ncbi:MAG TPA: DedA family protein [Acidimicrobiia bacterium]|nr:DedA family protein [Acidimicrobiia bacterium]
MQEFLTSLDPWLIYLIVGLLTLGESAAFLSLVFPGEIALVAAAAVGLSAGVDPILLAGVATVGAVVGGVLGYAVGRRYGPRLVSWEPISRRLGQRMTELRPLLAGPEAGALVAVARFNQITRAVVPALAGMAHMGRVRFAVANGIGALVWAAVFTAIGYYAAEWWHNTSGVIHAVMAVALLGVLASWLFLRRRRRSPGTSVTDV